jgi:hypothetical protein
LKSENDYLVANLANRCATWCGLDLPAIQQRRSALMCGFASVWMDQPMQLTRLCGADNEEK